MSYPDNDSDFIEGRLKSVTAEKGGGWSVSIAGDWGSFYIPPTGAAVPEVGMCCRRYGNIRGIFLDDKMVFYRTAEDHKEYQEIELYGRDADDWLDRWDNGKIVWSIAMGGLGPGYEQCIQITAAEFLRWYLKNKPDLNDEAKYDSIRRERDAAVSALPSIEKLGLSGAQAGAAGNLAGHLYRRGPREIMNDLDVADRRIQVKRDFP